MNWLVIAWWRFWMWELGKLSAWNFAMNLTMIVLIVPLIYYVRKHATTSREFLDVTKAYMRLHQRESKEARNVVITKAEESKQALLEVAHELKLANDTKE